MDEHALKTPDQILQAALAREEEACDFYRNLAIHCHVDFVKVLLEKLGNEEARHVDLVQAMITRLQLGENIV